MRLTKFFAEAPPEVSETLVRLLEDSVARLGRFPFIGRSLGRADLRETIVRFGKSTYVIRYRVTDDLIDVTRIWHGPRKPFAIIRTGNLPGTASRAEDRSE